MREPTMVPVEQLHTGDEVVLPQIGPRPVVAIERYADETYVVVYVDSAMHCWENRAQDKGRWRIVSGTFEKSLRPMRAGELVPTLRLRLADDLDEGRVA